MENHEMSAIDEIESDSSDDGGGNGKEPSALCLKHHKIISTHQALIKSLQGELADARGFTKGLSEMFGKIMSATQEIKVGYERVVDKIALIDDTIKKCDDAWDRRFTEYKSEAQKMCALHRATFEQRLGTLEKIDDKTDVRIRRVEEMSDDSKVTYIGDLQAQLRARQSKWLSWKLAIFSGIIGLVCAASGVLAKGCMDARQQKTQPALVAPSGDR